LNALEISTPKKTQNPKMKPFFFLKFGSGNTSLEPLFVSWVPAVYDCETEGGSDEGSS